MFDGGGDVMTSIDCYRIFQFSRRLRSFSVPVVPLCNMKYVGMFNKSLQPLKFVLTLCLRLNNGDYLRIWVAESRSCVIYIPMYLRMCVVIILNPHYNLSGIDSPCPIDVMLTMLFYLISSI